MHYDFTTAGQKPCYYFGYNLLHPWGWVYNDLEGGIRRSATQKTSGVQRLLFKDTLPFDSANLVINLKLRY